MKKSRIIKWLLAIIIIAGLSIWVNSRWSVWFGDLPEPEYKVENNHLYKKLNDGEWEEIC